jgi:glycosyltransferase involved in cell wall biosynthesis
MMSSALPPITAIICTYRRPEMLKRAIQSVQSQTFGDFQICIYDNASGDETAAVVAELAQRDSRIKYHCRPENLGLVGNYLAAMEDVQTPFFSFLADDDVMLPNFYQVAIESMGQNPEAMLFAGSFSCLSMEGEKLASGLFDDELISAPAGVFKFVETDLYPNLHGTLIRREAIGQCADFEAFRNCLWFDQDFICRIAAAHSVITSSKPCLIFTVHNIDKGREVNIDHAWRVHESVSQSLQSILTDVDNRRLQTILKNRIKNNTYFLAIELLYEGDFSGVRNGARKIRKDYGNIWQPYALELLAVLFEKIPLLRIFLSSTRNSRPDLKQQKEHPEILSYDALLDIHGRQ